MKIPSNLLYTEEHEWVLVEGKKARVGITDYAQDQLGDVVYVELPEPGTRIEKGKPFGVVESVKSVSDLYAPVTGTVLRVNESLVDEPEKVNQSPYDEGWMLEVELEDPEELEDLLSPQAYRLKVEES
ncbi:MAG: glycine cleavage system protein GcvH [Clostridiales bacterium]|nr:glycine cleavage system protein GcvH [Clostridiales bacterium]